MGGILTKLDFAEEGMEDLQQLGIFRGMYSGFDLYFFESWRWISNSGPIHAIAYDVNADGIDKFIIVGGDDNMAVNVQVFTANRFIVQLGDPMFFYVD